MELIVNTLAGSKAYGLSTPTSDTDYRGVFIHTEVSKIIGLERHDHETRKTETEDEVNFELRHFLNLLRNGNSGALEILFTETPECWTIQWQEVKRHMYQLLDSEKIFRCLRGYMQGERRLMNGERTGVLGSNRKVALDKFGYSPKNAVQLFRLAWAGGVFFQKGFFPVYIPKENSEFARDLLDIKLHPERHKIEDLNKAVDLAEQRLVALYETRKFNYKFNTEVANKLILDIYKKYLK